MSNYIKFNFSNNEHIVHLQKALDLAQNQSLDVADKYLIDRFQVPPLCALMAIYAENLGYQASPIQSCYIQLYTNAIRRSQPWLLIDDHNSSDDFPECHHPNIEDIIS